MEYRKMGQKGKIIEGVVWEYRKCNESYKELNKSYEVLFKEWEREEEKGLDNDRVIELGEKVDEAYEKMEEARKDRNIKAVACLDMLLEEGLI